MLSNLGYNTGEISSRKFVFSKSSPVGTNPLEDIKNSYTLIKNISTFNYEGIHIDQLLLLLYGQNDVYFDLNKKNEQLIHKISSQATIKQFENKDHDWPIFFPTKTNEEINKFYDSHT